VFRISVNSSVRPTSGAWGARSIGRRFLDPVCSVDDVPEENLLPAIGARPQRHDRFTGVHGDTRPVAERVADRQGRAYPPLWIVLPSHGRPEHGHDGVPDVLLDRAAVALERFAHQRELRPDRSAELFRILL
jgi:hypothetical protein